MLTIDLELLKKAEIPLLDQLITFLTPLDIESSKKESLVHQVVAYYSLVTDMIIVDEDALSKIGLNRFNTIWNQLSSDDNSPKLYGSPLSSKVEKLIQDLVSKLNKDEPIDEIAYYVTNLIDDSTNKLQNELDDIFISKSKLANSILKSIQGKQCSVYVNLLGFKVDTLAEKEVWGALIKLKKGDVLTILMYNEHELNVSQYTAANQVLRVQRMPYLTSKLMYLDD